MAERRPTLKTVFVDSSVLFTAVNSVSGGSSKLFTLSYIKLLTSKVVLAEVERNVRAKLESYNLDRFFMLVAKIEIITSKPDKKLILKAKKAIVDKDAVILAEGKKIKADYLVTLDRKHFMTPTVAKFLSPKKAVTPKELIEKFEN